MVENSTAESYATNCNCYVGDCWRLLTTLRIFGEKFEMFPYLRLFLYFSYAHYVGSYFRWNVIRSTNDGIMSKHIFVLTPRARLN